MIENVVVEEVREILQDVYTERGVNEWLTSRNRHLWDAAPVDLINDGHGEEVLREARRVAEA